MQRVGLVGSKIQVSKRGFLATFCALALLAQGVCAQEEDEKFGPQPTGAPKAKERYEADLKAHDGNADKLVLPGLVADRKSREVEVMVECTGLKAQETVEFLLVDQGSSHGYEAMLWSHAKPSDIHRALEFIGLQPGTPVDPRALRFWSDGDRVTVSIRSPEGDEVPIEQLIFDTEADKTLPEDGFVFAGSMILPKSQGTDAAGSRYAADVYDPRAVASVFNDPTGVLDVPRQVNQGEVYGRLVVNPEHGLKGGSLLCVVMRPGAQEGKARAQRLRLALDLVAGGLTCRLSETNGTVLRESNNPTPVLEHLVALKKDGPPPSLELEFGEALPIAAVEKTCVLMSAMEVMGVARIQAPATNQLYFRAFVPSKEWKTPEGRPSQPWELHLRRKDGKVAAELVWHERVEGDDGSAQTFKPRKLDVAAPDAVRDGLAAHAQERAKAGLAPLPAVLLVYAEPGLTYGQVMAFVRPSMASHGTIYVFVEEEPAATPPVGGRVGDAP